MSAQGSNESVGWPYLKRIYARSFAQQPTGQAYCILRTGRTKGYLVSDGTLRDVIKNLPSRRSSGSSTRSDFAVMFAILRSRHNPKILWIDDAEIVRDRITEVRPIPGNCFTQETERRIGELGASCVAFIVRDVSVHEAP
jgi:hypothetical protein